MKSKYLLSLDGGGVREVATVIFLAKLERELGKPLYEQFDLFVGSSAGAITAMAISVAKMRGDSLLKLWSEKNLDRILESSLWDSKLGLMQTNPKYDGRGKRRVLKEYFGDKVYKTTIHRNVRLGEAPSYGEPILLYDASSIGAQDYMSLTLEILKKNE